MILDKEIKKIIDASVDDFLMEMKMNLSKSGKSDSNLAKSIKGDTTSTTADISMEEYGIFVDKGVTGKNDADFKGKRKTVFRSKENYKFGKGRKSDGSFKKKIDDWMSSKGIAGGIDKNGKKVSKDSINYMIRKSIIQHGVEPTMFASEAYDNFTNNLKKRLESMDMKKFIDIPQQSKKK